MRVPLNTCACIFALEREPWTDQERTWMRTHFAKHFESGRNPGKVEIEHFKSLYQVDRDW